MLTWTRVISRGCNQRPLDHMLSLLDDRLVHKAGSAFSGLEASRHALGYWWLWQVYIWLLKRVFPF